jgi:stage III sporulation protein AH
VKRQSVWLSTMMVLALMLIGYYTVNNNVKMVPVADTPSIGNPSFDANANSATGDSGSGNQNGTNGKAAVDASSNFFIAMHMREEKEQAAYLETLQQVLSNRESTSEQIAQAQQKMQEINDMNAKADHVRDMLQADGYPDAIVIPNDNDGIQFDHVTVYVQANQLSADQAVKVMNIVHTQMGVAMANISVGYHP